MKTIDEIIKRCEAVAEDYERHLKVYENMDEDRPLFKEEENECKECAEEHRQLAAWLRELKELRDFANFVAESVMEEDFEEDSDFYAEIFCRKLYKMGYIENVDGKWIFNDEEVNTDG